MLGSRVPLQRGGFEPANGSVHDAGWPSAPDRRRIAAEVGASHGREMQQPALQCRCLCPFAGPVSAGGLIRWPAPSAIRRINGQPAHFSDRRRCRQRARRRRFRLIVDDQLFTRVIGLMVAQSSTIALKRPGLSTLARSAGVGNAPPQAKLLLSVRRQACPRRRLLRVTLFRRWFSRANRRSGERISRIRTDAGSAW